MKTYTNVSRKTVDEDRIAICPNFGCEYMMRVKPLKIRFFGFGKYPKCKRHHIPLVYVDEMISDFVDAALACLFDKAGLPSRKLLKDMRSRFPQEIESFVKGWVYCITVGRGAPIVSHYMDSISNAYLKQLTRRQIRALKKGENKNANLVNRAIKDGMNEISIQYTRILKHLRVHSEVLSKPEDLKPLSKDLRKYLNEWEKYMLNSNEKLVMSETKCELSLDEIKHSYDQILNAGICRCLLGLDPETKENKRARVTAFDRFSVYSDFLSENITEKFTKSDIHSLTLDIDPTNKSIKKLSSNSIKEYLRNLDWKSLTDNWTITHRKHLTLPYMTILLDPHKDPSGDNPLYKHKIWLKRVYEDESLNLNGVEIARICGLEDQKPISYWRKRFGIPKKRKGVFIDKQGHKLILTPDSYIHPQRGKIHQRAEHILILEHHLNTNLSRQQLIVHPNLIQGWLEEKEYFYIKKNCHAHHINYRASDNRIENIWLFSSNRAHGLVINELNQCFSVLIKLGQIYFKDDYYYLTQDFDCRQLEKGCIRRRLNINFEINNTLPRFYDERRNTFSVAMPKTYSNPYISKKRGMNYVYMYEHRFIIERYYRNLLKDGVKVTEKHGDHEKAKKFIDPQGFLKPNAIVHHINFDSQDNRLLNLYVGNKSEHRLVHGSIYQLVATLLEMELIYFSKGKYFLDNTLSNKIRF